MTTTTKDRLERLVTEKKRLEESARELKEKKRMLENKLRYAEKEHSRAKALRNKVIAGEICCRFGLIDAVNGDFQLLARIVQRAVSQWKNEQQASTTLQGLQKTTPQT